MEPIWAPHVLKDLNDAELALYLEFSCTACIPGGGCNVEKALQVLYKSDGNIKLALERLLNAKDLHSLTQHDHAIWNEDEVHLFERLIMLHGKNFYFVSQDIKTKSVKECVEFYYLWKKSPIRVHHSINSSLSSSLSSTSSSTSTNSISTTSSITTNNTTATSDNQSLAQSSESNAPLNGAEPSQEEQFPCKVCGRVFLKIKSRSAHMKRHKNER